MNFPSIDIQGSILSTDLLAKIRSEQATFQQGKDFNPDLTNAKLKDEISLAWQEAKGQWTIYKSKLARLKEGETGTTETRNFWISPILTNLGYNLTFDRKGEELNGKSFPIGYRDSSLDNFPVYVGGYHESLDKRPENKQLRVSPHAMVQEYLNYSEHLYGMVTNGRQLRLLRDASRITRLSYVEFNLEKMMEEDLYSDFVIFYRLLHASRMPKKIDGGAESIMEKYHQEGLEAGSTIRNKLGEAVKGAIKNLANGFINHPNNAALRDAVATGNINTDEYYRHQLRIIYRLLFLFVIEERNLVYADSKTPETKRFNHIYFNYYSLLRLRKLAKKLLSPEANRHYDLWQSLVSTFSLFEKNDIGEKLGIMSLQGDLFGYHAISNSQYDLHQCYLSNAVLLNIIKSLSYFENDNGVLIAVNYGGLDVEEFGSVYEGLLELKLEFNKVEGTDNYSVNWQKQAGGREFQSHYTPEELVQPLIKHSLEYLIEDRIKNPKQFLTPAEIAKASPFGGGLVGAALLKLKVCDVACGSGHILLSAARRIALAVARVLTDEEQPNPLSIRKAMKDVVRNCIYGVDKNPLAVELCKIALWLEAYNPGEPLNFLDHHIKCGDAIVGLAHRSELEKGIADEAFKTLPGDDKDIAAAFRKRNQQERKQKTQTTFEFDTVVNDEVNAVIEKYNLFKNLPETTPDEVAVKEKEYRKFELTVERIRLKQLADAQVAQYFIPKTDATKVYLLTDAEYQGFLRNVHKGMGPLQSQKLSYVETLLPHYRFFHWFIEFPEVFYEGGFDCILGNPPYLGGRDVSLLYGKQYHIFLTKTFFPAGGVCDLIGYFIRRIFSVQKANGYLSIITTKSIAEGDTREGGLEIIITQGGEINFASKSLKWPGVAAVQVTLLSIFNGRFEKIKFLAGNEVSAINSYLGNSNSEYKKHTLINNSRICFKGSEPLGDGFIIDEKVAKELIREDDRYKQVLFPYINGSDLNNDYLLRPGRWIINFFDWTEEKAKQFPACYNRVLELVKPERDLVSREARRDRWWQYGEKASGLYKSIKDNDYVLVTAFTSKYLSFSKIEPNIIFANACIVNTNPKPYHFSFLQSSIHEMWVIQFSSSLGISMRYTPSDVFDTFPFPQNLNPQQEQQIETIGEAYHEHRRQLMLGMQLGLTKTYNLFHSNAIAAQSINDKDKQVASLQKHLDPAKSGAGKTANTISFDEAIQGILKLRELHVQMDEAVLSAYGWNNDELKIANYESESREDENVICNSKLTIDSPVIRNSQLKIDLKHDFYEVDYLPENDRVRFTIHPDARKEVLKRLLELNHKIHEEEVEKGLWDKKKTVSKKSNVVNEPQVGYGGDLFNQE